MTKEILNLAGEIALEIMANKVVAKHITDCYCCVRIFPPLYVHFVRIVVEKMGK